MYVRVPTPKMQSTLVLIK